MWPTCQATWLTPPGGCRNHSVGGRLVEQPDGVVAGEDDLLDGELQPGHGYFSFAGSVPTNFIARSNPAVQLVVVLDAFRLDHHPVPSSACR